MTQEADFCGDRLRLSAFLRVVDGMPQRPTRFRHRLVETKHSLVASNQRCASLVGVSSHQDQDSASEQSLVILKVVRSPTLETPEFAAEHLQSTNQSENKPQNDCSQHEGVQCKPVQRQSVKQLPNSENIEPIRKPRRVSSTRKRQHLPVNELALLRTTSTDGLPSPSDADHIFTVPVATLDPIEDSQTLSAAPLKNATGRRRGQRLEKLSPALLLRERYAHICLTNHQGSQNSAFSRHEFATASDGFVGSELNIQHTASQQRRRTSNRSMIKKKSAYSNSNNELTLACGYLPAPLVGHRYNALVRGDSQLYTAGSRAAGTTTFPDGSQSGIAGMTMVTTEKEAKEHLRSRTQYYDDLVRNPLCNVTVSIENLPEQSCSGSTDNANEAVTDSYITRFEVGQTNERFTPHWLRTPSTGRTYDLFKHERYSERTVQDLNTEGRSDSVSDEFWSQYGGLERSDGAWDARGATTLHHL